MRIHSKLDQIHFREPLNQICWHPTQHVVALCSYGGAFPVALYAADRDPSLVYANGENGDGISTANETDEDAKERVDAEKAALAGKREENQRRYIELKEKALERKKKRAF
jgi:hypothetical protein